MRVPESVQYIDKYAFYNCATLERIAFAEGSRLRNVDRGVFSGTAITEIRIPKAVQTIGENAFSRCDKL